LPRQFLGRNGNFAHLENLFTHNRAPLYHELLAIPRRQMFADFDSG
jgi:hypothetical protein